MLGVSQPRLEGELLQVHQRDPQRHRGHVEHSGLKFLARVNGACAGGGYELALACDEILLVDDALVAVSLPEVPLLGVLPGTGGPDPRDRQAQRAPRPGRHVLHHARRARPSARRWRLVDAIAKPAAFAQAVRTAPPSARRDSDRPADAQGVALRRSSGTIEPDALRYAHVTVQIDRAARTATFTLRAPRAAARDDRRDRSAGAAGGRSRWRASSTTRS
jgi:benzoyl-CoA-dihydrodiol lyase